MTRFVTFKENVLRFLNRCGVAGGIADETAWEAAGCPPVTSAEAARFVTASAPRIKPLAERLTDNDWAFASTPGGGESLEGAHSAVETLYLLGELDRLTATNRRSWVDYFNRYQDEATGYYLGPYLPSRDHPSWRDPVACTHPWDHMHDHLVSCLCPTLMLLGGQSRFPLSRGSQTGRFLDRDYLEHFLTGRDWNDYRGDGNYRRHNPWWMGNVFWYPACLLWQISVWESGSPAAVQARRMLDEVWYPWHDRNFAVNGFWAGDLDGDPARLWHGRLSPGRLPAEIETPAERHGSAMTIMGGAHQLWFYDFDNHPIADAVRRAQTDGVLALQNRHNGHFGMGDVDNPGAWSNNCTDVDCLTVLAINHHRQDYRREDIAAAAERAVIVILTDRLNTDGVLESVPGAPFSHCFNSWPTYSPAGAGNMLNQSFYLWAVVAACAVVERPTSAAVRSFAEHPWPQTPSHWLWTPARASGGDVRKRYSSLRVTLEDESPVLDLAPDHSRMVSCYRDGAGVYHLFTDFIAAGLRTVHSWEAEIRHFRSRDLKTWEAVTMTTFRRGPEGSPDSFGVASPHVLSVPEKGRVYLFYAGRGHPRPGEAWNSRAVPGEPGYVSSHIMLASAEADADGAPLGPFGERRLIVGLDAAWRNMRVDDPCAIVVDCHVHLYFKGFGVPGPFQAGTHDILKCGYASADLDDMRFDIRSAPLSGLDGGEMPRVFTLGDQWHLLYRHFVPAPGETHWRQYTSADGIHWRLHQPCLFTRPHCPRDAPPYDMVPVYGLNGRLAEPLAALACGQDQTDGCLKQWLYRLEIS